MNKKEKYTRKKWQNYSICKVINKFPNGCLIYVLHGTKYQHKSLFHSDNSFFIHLFPSCSFSSPLIHFAMLQPLQLTLVINPSSATTLFFSQIYFILCTIYCAEMMSFSQLNEIQEGGFILYSSYINSSTASQKYL